MIVSSNRLLIAGVGPVPPERPGRLFAPGLRIWGMARELARAGHPVRLVCARYGWTGATAGGEGDERTVADRFDLKPAEEPQLPEGQALDVAGGEWPGLLARETEAFGATAAVGSTDVMNHALAGAGLSIPIWMDYFGDPMAERQLLALRLGSDAGLVDQWAMLAPALARADRLSGCSHQACGALLGQLGVLGRLGRHTARETLVHYIPPWLEPIEPDKANGADEALVRGRLVPADAFMIIQTGGFNTWLDVETLFATLERVMNINPRIHFAATGGAIPGHTASAFWHFTKAVNASPHRERFHLLGWLPLGQVPRLIAEGDMGLNVDIACPEGMLGTRNRILDWLAGGLPVVSTPGCELAGELGERGYLRLADHGDPEALAGAILQTAEEPGPAREGARLGIGYLHQIHTPVRCLAPLMQWAEEPKPASDLHRWEEGTDRPSALHDQARRETGRLQQQQRLAERVAELEGQLARLRGSRLVRWALKLRRRNDL